VITGVCARAKYRLPFVFISLVFVSLYFLIVSQANAIELSGYITAEGRGFFNDPLFNEQRRDSASIAIQPEIYHEMENGSSFVFTPFARLDSADDERTHVDIRELNYLWLHDDFELRVGIGKVFWGVTEFLHLVDIINQTDLVEYIDGEDKLGQPMLHLSVPREWGVVDLFVLPYFRERTFPGEQGRFRTQIVVDTDKADYESSAGENNIDLAFRYSHTIGDWDFGIYHFHGTAREPSLLLRSDQAGKPFLLPFYEQIDQSGLDVQTVKGNWLLKLESIYRTGQGDDFFACIGGFEYSFVNIRSSGIDLGLIGEWAYDERGSGSTTGFDNDLMAGARLALNDADSTEVLAGFKQGLDSDERVLSVESSRRIGDNWKVAVDALFVLDSSVEDPIHALRDDDNIQIELMYYF
jgi:hypothetical protein